MPASYGSIAVASTVAKGSSGVLGCCKGEKTDNGVTKAPTTIIDLVALVGVTFSILTISYAGATSAFITAGFLIVFSPYMAVQKRRLLNLGGFRNRLNQLRQDTNSIMFENNNLSRNVSKLQSSVAELERIENDLMKYANTDNLDRLVVVIEEQKKINAAIKDKMERSAIQDIITTVIRTDRDMDMNISSREMKKLMMRLGSREGFEVDKECFLKLLGNPQKHEEIPISKIMNVIRDLKNNKCSGGKHAIIFHPNDVHAPPQ